jgi:hypothetical protein
MLYVRSGLFNRLFNNSLELFQEEKIPEELVLGLPGRMKRNPTQTPFCTTIQMALKFFVVLVWPRSGI